MTIEPSLQRVLRCFELQDTIRFVELATKLGFGGDLTGYYLRKLEQKGLVEKTVRGTYCITPYGKSFLAHQGNLKGVYRPRVSVMLLVKRADQVVIKTRQTQPFIGRNEWPTTPLYGGELVQEAAKRLASEICPDTVDFQPETPKFFRRIDMIEKDVFDDKVFAVFSVVLPGNISIKHNGQNGVYKLVSELELINLPHQAASLHDIYSFMKTREQCTEKTYQLSLEDLRDPRV